VEGNSVYLLPSLQFGKQNPEVPNVYLNIFPQVQNLIVFILLTQCNLSRLRISISSSGVAVYEFQNPHKKGSYFDEKSLPVI